MASPLPAILLQEKVHTAVPLMPKPALLTTPPPPLIDEDVIKRAKLRVAQMKGEGEGSGTHHSRDILGLLQIPQDKDKAWSRPAGQTVCTLLLHLEAIN